MNYSKLYVHFSTFSVSYISVFAVQDWSSTRCEEGWKATWKTDETNGLKRVSLWCNGNRLMSWPFFNHCTHRFTWVDELSVEESCEVIAGGPQYHQQSKGVDYNDFVWMSCAIWGNSVTFSWCIFWISQWTKIRQWKLLFTGLGLLFI